MTILAIRLKVELLRGRLQRTSAKISDFQTTPLPVRVRQNFLNHPLVRIFQLLFLHIIFPTIIFRHFSVLHIKTKFINFCFKLFLFIKLLCCGQHGSDRPSTVSFYTPYGLYYVATDVICKRSHIGISIYYNF